MNILICAVLYLVSYIVVSIVLSLKGMASKEYLKDHKVLMVVLFIYLLPVEIISWIIEYINNR